MLSLEQGLLRTEHISLTIGKKAELKILLIFIQHLYYSKHVTRLERNVLIESTKSNFFKHINSQTPFRDSVRMNGILFYFSKMILWLALQFSKTNKIIKIFNIGSGLKRSIELSRLTIIFSGCFVAFRKKLFNR